MNDRGVSEVVGFVLVFALVTGTIGVVYGTGVVGLHDAQGAEKVNNVERAFDVLADNIEDVHRTGAPSRATEVKLAGGSLRVGEPVTIQVNASNGSDVIHNDTQLSYLPIVFEDDEGASLDYSNGAVIRSERGGHVMLSEPGWVIGSERSVIPLVNTYGSGGGISGEGAVLIVAERGGQQRQPPVLIEDVDEETITVNVTVTSPHAVVWERYFEEQGFSDIDRSGDTVSGAFDTTRLYVPQTSIEISFNR